MATQKLLRSRKICVEDSGLAIAGGKEDFSRRNEQDLNTVSVPIDYGARYGALRELHGGEQEYTAITERS
jgi:hypothetical protein